MSLQTFQWQSQLAQAKNALISGDFTTAENCLSAAINFGHTENAPEEAVADIFYHRGILYESVSRFEDAKRSFNQSYHTFARCLGPTSKPAVKAAKAKCLVEIKMGRTDDARLHFERILELLTGESGENNSEVIALKEQIKELFSQIEPQVIPSVEVEIEPYVDVDSWRPARRTVELEKPKMPPEFEKAKLPPEAPPPGMKKSSIQATLHNVIAHRVQELAGESEPLTTPAIANTQQPSQPAAGAPGAREAASAKLAAAAAAAAAAGAKISSTSLPASTLPPALTQKTDSPAAPPAASPAAPLLDAQNIDAAAKERSTSHPQSNRSSFRRNEADDEFEENPWAPLPAEEPLHQPEKEDQQTQPDQTDADIKVRIVRSSQETSGTQRAERSDRPTEVHTLIDFQLPPHLSIVSKQRQYPPELERRTEPAKLPDDQVERRAENLLQPEGSGSADSLNKGFESLDKAPEGESRTTENRLKTDETAAGKISRTNVPTFALPETMIRQNAEPAIKPATESFSDGLLTDAPQQVNASANKDVAELTPAPQLEGEKRAPESQPDNAAPLTVPQKSESNRARSEKRGKFDMRETMIDRPRIDPLFAAANLDPPPRTSSIRDSSERVELQNATDSQASKQLRGLTDSPTTSAFPAAPTSPKTSTSPAPAPEVSPSRSPEPAAKQSEAPVTTERPADSRKTINKIPLPTVDLEEAKESLALKSSTKEPKSNNDEIPTVLVSPEVVERAKRGANKPAANRPLPPAKPLIAHRQFLQPIDITALIHPRDRIYTLVAKIIAAIAYGLAALSFIGLILAPILFLAKWIACGINLGQIRGRGIKVSSEQFPEVYESLHHMSVALGLPTPPEAYVVHEHGLLNAMAKRLHGRDIVIIYADVLEMAFELGNSEVAFVIAHELAHVRCGHVKWSWVDAPASLIPFFGHALSRAREYTCDRIAQELVPDGAAMGLVALAAGKKLYKRVNLKALYNQQDAEWNFWTWFSEILSTHPNLLNRIHALGLRSEHIQDTTVDD
jgi:Zn-dependent protease with chaperone function